MFEPLIDVALITALVQAVKMATKIDKRYVPLLSIALGIGVVAIYQDFSKYVIMDGLLLGLTSCGLYSSGKALIGK